MITCTCSPAPDRMVGLDVHSATCDFAVAMAEANRQVAEMAAAAERTYGPPPASFSAWCACGPEVEGVYFLRADGSHGWWHPTCRGLVQSG